MSTDLDKLARLDELDVKILTILMEDSRTSLNKIAEKIGASVATVSARVKKLESLGVISKYTVYINCKNLGFQASAFFLIKTNGDTDGVAEALSNIHLTRAVYRVAGRFDLVVQVTCINIDDLSSFINEVKSIPGVIEVESMIILKIFKDRAHPGPETLKQAIRVALGEKR